MDKDKAFIRECLFMAKEVYQHEEVELLQKKIEDAIDMSRRYLISVGFSDREIMEGVAKAYAEKYMDF